MALRAHAPVAVGAAVGAPRRASRARPALAPCAATARRAPLRRAARVAAAVGDAAFETAQKALGARVANSLEGTSLFVVGMMGSGKSTVGKLLAQRLGYTHLDTDALVHKMTGMSVAQIFEAEGEEAFRDVEAAVLNEVASYARMVVSTGGGVVMRRTNWGHLRNGVVLYLEAPVDVLAARVAADGVALRPLLKGAPAGGEFDHAKRVLEETYASRVDMYRQADVTVAQAAAPGDGTAAEEPAATAARALAAVEAMLAADDTRERLRRVPTADSVKLEGGRGPTQI